MRLFIGSIPTGAVWRVDARTGEGERLVAGVTGRAAIGLEADNRGRLFVAGGATGKAFVYDARSGADLADFQLAPGGAPTFVKHRHAVAHQLGDGRGRADRPRRRDHARSPLIVRAPPRRSRGRHLS